MAINSHIQDHLDKRSGGLTYVASGEVAHITSVSVSAQRIAELERVADVTGHELQLVGQVLTLVPKGAVQVGQFTVTIASPGVFTLTAHGLSVGSAIKLTTTSALPTGLSAGVVYYVIAAGFGANSFQVSLTPGGAAVNTSVSQSGTHTAWKAV
jgi:hypothetical protein